METKSNYWNKFISRRRALRAAALAGGGAAALALIGCGGDDDGGGVKGDASGFLSEPQDTRSKAVRGGHYQSLGGLAPPPSFDTHAANSGAADTHTTFVYPHLMQQKNAKYPEIYTGDVEGHQALSWEVTDEGLTYTFKLRRDMLLEDKAPTNHRPLDAQDVLFSYDRFATVAGVAIEMVQARHPDSPILGMTAIDNYTVQMKLAYPWAPTLLMLAFGRALIIMPRESNPDLRGTAGGFDSRNEVRGAGPYHMTKYERSQLNEYTKNPEYYEADRYHLDKITLYVIPEYATGLAQFRTGNLWRFPVKPEDQLVMKRDLPELVMKQASDSTANQSVSPYMSFSTRPGSPFIDERVRRAVSRLHDRQLFIDTFYNTANFATAGLPVTSYWNSGIAAGWTGFWLDPQTQQKELGEYAGTYQYNPAEAKKLLRAAGHTGPIESVFQYTHNGYDDLYRAKAQAQHGMLEAHGDFKLKIDTKDYTAEWLPNHHLGQGVKFDGISVGSGFSWSEIDLMLTGYYKTGGSRQWVGTEDKELDALINKQKVELNREKRFAIINDIQRRLAKTVPGMLTPGSADGFNLTWPWIGNDGLWSGTTGSFQTYRDIWYDKSKDTQGRAS